MKIDRSDPKHLLLLAVQAFNTFLACMCRPFMRKPAKPVVVLYGHQLSGNLRALYEEWEKDFQDSMSIHFLSLDPEYGAQLSKSGVNVLQCSRTIDMLKVGNCHAIITDHGVHAMQPLLSLTDIRFIDVWHGIPFKGFVPEDFRLQHRYDEVWVSSPLLKDIYVEKFGFDPDRVLPIGYARVDKLFRRDTPRDDLRALLGIPPYHRIVLYAPTWRQDDQGRELFPFGETQTSFLTRLGQVCGENNATLVVRSHLNAQIPRAEIPNVTYCSMKEYANTEELLLHVDVLICDWSSIAFDYLALARPTIFLDVKPPFKNGFTLGPKYRFGEIVGSTAQLAEAMSTALTCRAEYQTTPDSFQKVSQAVYGSAGNGYCARQQLHELLKRLEA